MFEQNSVDEQVYKNLFSKEETMCGRGEGRGEGEGRGGREGGRGGVGGEER